VASNDYEISCFRIVRSGCVIPPAAVAKLQVKLGDHSGVTLADDAVAIAGFYDFSRPAADGHPVVVPGRFSFVMVKKDGIWKIAHHHSSVRPKSPQ
jgi:hypothetical protein